jgi:hypothetical protein
MGTWGAGIMDNDIASDINARFRTLMDEGKTVPEGIDLILLENRKLESDPDDSADLLLALGWLASSHGPVPTHLADRVKELIEQGISLARWSGSAGMEARSRAERELLNRLGGTTEASLLPRKMVRPRKLPYREGDWFTIPLDSGGFAIGLIARMNGKGRLLGYFFGPRRQEPPVPDDVTHLRPTDAMSVELCGDPGILTGNWKIFFHDNNWTRVDWPLPSFGFEDRLINAIYQRLYAEDTLKYIRQERVPRSVYLSLPSDGIGSARSVEIFLDHRLPK